WVWAQAKVPVGTVPMDTELVPRGLDLSAWAGQRSWHILKFCWADQSSWPIGSRIKIKHGDIAQFLVVCTSNHFTVKASFAVMACSLGFGQVELFRDQPQPWRSWSSAKRT
ncbi:hypothetical protein VP01_1995g1, partial [Puccinia sorghi]